MLSILNRCIEYIAVEGTVSQIFDIGPSSFFIKLRKNIQKNYQKVAPFFDIK